MIRDILGWLVVGCCSIPVLMGARSLIRDAIHRRRDRKAVKHAMNLTINGKLMNRDWNFNTVWLYDNPVEAEKQAGDYGWGWHACMICIHLYVAHGENHRPADWKVGYSCLKSMNVNVIGYCDKHYAYLQPEIDAGRVLCGCEGIAGVTHDFEEIMIDDINGEENQLN